MSDNSNSGLSAPAVSRVYTSEPIQVGLSNDGKSRIMSQRGEEPRIGEEGKGGGTEEFTELSFAPLEELPEDVTKPASPPPLSATSGIKEE